MTVVEFEPTDDDSKRIMTIRYNHDDASEMNSHDCYDDLKFLTRYIYPTNFPIFESIGDSRKSVLNYS